MMQCTGCGYRIDADARECPLCGERMKRVSGRKANKTPEPSAHAAENHGHCATEPWPQEKKQKSDYRRQAEEAGVEGKPMVASGFLMVLSVIFCVTACISALMALFFDGAYLFNTLNRLILANLFFGLSRVPCQPVVPRRPVEKKKFITVSIIAAVVTWLLSLMTFGGGISLATLVGIAVLVAVAVALGKMRKK